MPETPNPVTGVNPHFFSMSRWVGVKTPSGDQISLTVIDGEGGAARASEMSDRLNRVLAGETTLEEPKAPEVVRLWPYAEDGLTEYEGLVLEAMRSADRIQYDPIRRQHWSAWRVLKQDVYYILRGDTPADFIELYGAEEAPLKFEQAKKAAEAFAAYLASDLIPHAETKIGERTT